MTTKEYLSKVIKSNCKYDWKMYKLYCFNNNLKEDKFDSLVKWVNK